MKFEEVETKIIESGIQPVPIARICEGSNDSYYLFIGELEEYITILKENQIKIIFYEKIFITEDDFLFLLNDEDEKIVQDEPSFEIDEEIGAIKMVSYNKELLKYTKYIGEVRGYRFYAILSGKEIVAKIDQAWSDKFIGQHLSTVRLIEDKIDLLKKSTMQKKK